MRHDLERTAMEPFADLLQECATDTWYEKVCKRRQIVTGRTHDLRKLEPTWQKLREGRPLDATDLDALLDKTHFGEFWKLPSTFDRERLAEKKISLRMADDVER